MRCLWLTWIDPDPEHDGQRIYSGRLIDALGQTGLQLDVLCTGHAQTRHRSGETEGNVRWWLGANGFRSAWTSVLSGLPHVAHRSRTSDMQRGLAILLRSAEWDCIVFDGIYPGWALESCLAYRRRRGSRPQLVYISHNHEASMRADLAAGYRGGAVKQVLLRRDAGKAAQLERRMVAAADLVTAITPDDAALFQAEFPGKEILVLPPGYNGRRLSIRRIGAEVPRRAVIVGSFDWAAKQANLRDFLAVADPLFAAAGAELQIVGSGGPRFFDGLRPTVAATRFVGPVEAVAPHLDDARIAIVAEQIGGGFKLKILDYVFNRLPIAALSGSVAGAPLRDNDSILKFESFDALARGALAVIDDFPLLNRLHEQAYSACALEFEWNERGQRLAGAIGRA